MTPTYYKKNSVNFSCTLFILKARGSFNSSFASVGHDFCCQMSSCPFLRQCPSAALTDMVYICKIFHTMYPREAEKWPLMQHNLFFWVWIKKHFRAPYPVKQFKCSMSSTTLLINCGLWKGPLCWRGRLWRVENNKVYFAGAVSSSHLYLEVALDTRKASWSVIQWGNCQFPISLLLVTCSLWSVKPVSLNSSE